MLWSGKYVQALLFLNSKEHALLTGTITDFTILRKEFADTCCYH